MSAAGPWLVDAADAGERVDRFLVARVPGLGRSGAARLCAAGQVRVNGRRVAKSALLAVGDAVSAELTPMRAEADASVPLVLALEREDLLIIDKPAGIPSAPQRPGERGTVANGLVARWPELAAIGHDEREPGLVHRLDVQTSGLLLVARSAPSFAALTRALRAGALDKRYLAVVESARIADEGTICAPLAPAGDPRRVRVAALGERSARSAETRFRVVRRFERWALVEAHAARAYRHQVRVHFASIGAPLVADALYGGVAEPALGARHALHAAELAWAGDATVAGFRATSPLPADLERLLR